MEEIKNTAGQSLGIAGLVLGILAIPLGIIPCTFILGILFGVTGIVLCIVALSQANRANGQKTLIIMALVCCILGLSFAAAWGVAFTHKNFFMNVLEEIKQGGNFEDLRDLNGNANVDIQIDSSGLNIHVDSDMKALQDTLKALEGELKDAVEQEVEEALPANVNINIRVDTASE